MTRPSHTDNPLSHVPADNRHPSLPAPTLRAEALLRHKTNPTSPPDSLSDDQATARQWSKPTPLSSAQPTSATPSANNASTQTPHHR